jgi:hypothetical protein
VVGDQAALNRLHRAGDHVIITLAKGGVITGRVTDELGMPMIGTQVYLRMVRTLDGQPPGVKTISRVSDRSRLTDDRGVYRLYGLEPGVYIVNVNDAAGDEGRDAPTYYPSATRDTAAEIPVHGGEEVPNIDIRHRAERGHVVSGKLTGELPSTGNFGSVAVDLIGRTDGQLFNSVGVSALAGNGRGFAFEAVPDGEYDLIAHKNNPNDRTKDDAAASPPRRVTVKDADVTGIELRLVKLASIAGRVVTEANSVQKTCEQKQPVSIEEILLITESEGKGSVANQVVMAKSLHSQPANYVAPNEKGEFKLAQLEAGRYRLLADLPGLNWYVRAITQPAPQTGGAAKGKADAARNPMALKAGEKLSGVEVAIAEGAASLSGRVISAKDGGNLPQRLRVHLLPAETTATDDVLRYREAMTGQNGQFEFKHLAPGKYFLLARSVSENEANSDTLRPAAFDTAQRIQLRREAEAAKNEITLEPCSRVKDQALRF